MAISHEIEQLRDDYLVERGRRRLRCGRAGCMAHGATRQEAIKNAENAIKFWLKTAKEDGLEIPQPRGRLVFA